MALIKEHCEEAYEEALKYLSHCVILSILLSVYSILYNGVLVLSMGSVAEPWQNRNETVADRWRNGAQTVEFWCLFGDFMAENYGFSTAF
jgi:hypothetical protein